MNINGKELESGDEVWVKYNKRLVSCVTYLKVKIYKISKDGTKIKVFPSSLDSEYSEYNISDIVSLRSLNDFWLEGIYMLHNICNSHFSIITDITVKGDDYDCVTHYTGHYDESRTVTINIPDGAINENENSYEKVLFLTKEAFIRNLCERMGIAKPRNFLKELLSASVSLKSEEDSPIDIEDWELTSMLYFSNESDIYAIDLSKDGNVKIVTDYIQNTPLCGFIDEILYKGWYFFEITDNVPKIADNFRSEEEYMENWNKVKALLKSREIQS